MRTLNLYLVIGLAGALGAMARFAVAGLCARLMGTAFPYGTFIINISGSFVLGWFATVVGERLAVSEHFRLAIVVGFLGAYTTFSTFMYESVALSDRGEVLKAAVNLFASLLVGLLAVRLGMLVAR